MKKVSFAITIAVMLCTNNFSNAQILSESFDASTFPPTGWTNVQISGAANPGTWQRLTAGTNPTCSPHSGAGMGYYNGYSWSGGNAGDLSTPALDFSSGSFAVSFWMYRDSGQLTKYDSVSVYVDVNTSSAGGTRLGVINRSKNLAPAVPVEGWYQYTFNIPGSYNTSTNHIIFKGTSDFGNRIYIDDISVYNLTPPNDLTGISATQNSICNGSSVKLYASGIDGTVHWYTGSCGGTMLGTGDSISVNPSQTTTYYARNFKNNIYSTNCSSISIIVNSNYVIAISDTICAHSNYTLADGTAINSAGIYSVTVPTINGCDSTVTVTLAVRPEITSGISQTICFGDSFLFNGNYYSQNGIYADTLTAINGCDSIVTLALTIRPEIASSFSQTICFGDSLLFNGHYYSQAGNYTDTLTAASGCDSIITLTLSILPEITTSVSQTICFGDSLLFNGNYYSQDGSYAQTFSASNGCDSTVTLTLTVRPQITNTIDLNICNSDSVLFNGNYYAQNGNYKDTLVAVTGCDSIVTLNLFVRPQITSTTGQSICSGDSLLYNGNYYYQAGNYADTLSSVNGCDSIVVLSLTANVPDTPVITQNGYDLSVQTFASYQWIKNGTPITGANSATYTATENGTYTVQVVDANGCSTVSATVSVTGVGIGETTDYHIQLFPNPVSNFLMFRNLPVNGKTEVHLFNTTGKLVLKKIMTENSLNVQLLPAGLYTLLIVSADNSQRHIFVKQ